MYYFLITNKQSDYHDCKSKVYFFIEKDEAEKAHNLAKVGYEIAWEDENDFYYEVSELFSVENNISGLPDIEAKVKDWLDYRKIYSYDLKKLEEIGYKHLIKPQQIDNEDDE